MAADTVLEARLTATLYSYLDPASGPHPRWLDAPAAGRVRPGQAGPSWPPHRLRLGQRGSRHRVATWAIAAAIVLGLAFGAVILTSASHQHVVGGPGPSPSKGAEPSAPAPLPANTISSPIRYGAVPELPPPLVEADDGSVWLRDGDGNAVRFDPHSELITKTVPMGTGTGAIADGAGSIWATGAEDGELIVRRISPTTGAIEVTTSYHLGDSAWRVIAVASDEVWALQPGSDAISRLGAFGTAPTVDFGTSAYDTTKIDYLLGTGSTANDAAVWAGLPATNLLVRIPIGAPRLALSIAGCGGVRFAADASDLWTVCGAELVQFDLVSGERMRSLPLPGDLAGAPHALALGGGWLWLAAGNAVLQLDPVSGRVLRRNVLGGPGWPVFAGGRLVVAGEDGTLSVITPGSP